MSFERTCPECFLKRINVSISRNSITVMYPLPVPSRPLFFHPFPLPFPSAMQADRFNHVIRHIILSSSVVSTLAGQAGTPGSADGIATNARFNEPICIRLDAAGTFAVVVRRRGWEPTQWGS